MSQLSFSSFDSSLMVRDAQGAICWRRPTRFWKLRARPSSARCSAVQRSLRRRRSRNTCAKLAGFEHEVFAVLFLDTRHRLIEYAEMFRGTIDGASVYPRELVKEALRLNAAAVIVSHNHPSGTRSRAGRADPAAQGSAGLVDVRVLDHVIVAGTDTASFAECG
jgi:DNA repair protein RadC